MVGQVEMKYTTYVLNEREKLSRAEFGQGTCTLFLPLLLGNPHVLLVGNLGNYVSYGVTCEQENGCTGEGGKK